MSRALRLPVGSLQPYLMVSVGYSRNHLGTTSGTVPGIGPVSFTGSTHHNFAYGGGAGVGIPIARNMVIDLTYEFLDLGEVRSGASGTVSVAGTPTTATAGSMKADLEVHTFQASLRFEF